MEGLFVLLPVQFHVVDQSSVYEGQSNVAQIFLEEGAPL